VYAAKSIGLFAILGGILAMLGAFVQINPVWLYGPYEPSSATTYAQPDYTLGWIEGAMRLFPGWEAAFAHRYRIPAGFWPAVLFPAATFLILYAWPFIDKRLTHDRAEHNVIERPRDRPLRSAFGLGVIVFYGILLIAGSQDIFASQLNTTIEPVTWSLRIGVITVPFVVGVISWKLLRDLKHSHEQPEMEDEPDAPNEVPPDLAPSPVGPAPELLAAGIGVGPVHGDGRQASGRAPTHPPAEARARVGVLGRVIGSVLAFLVSFVVDLLARRSKRKEREQRGHRQPDTDELVRSRD
jgi:hypothetical protein